MLQWVTNDSETTNFSRMWKKRSARRSAGVFCYTSHTRRARKSDVIKCFCHKKHPVLRPSTKGRLETRKTDRQAERFIEREKSMVRLARSKELSRGLRGVDERAILASGPTMCHLFSLTPGILHQSEPHTRRRRRRRVAEEEESGRWWR